MSKKLYVYYGEEAFLVDQAVQELKRKILDPSQEAFGFQLLETGNANTDNIVNAVQTIPSFTPERVVLLKNPQFLNVKAGREAEEDSPEQSEQENNNGTKNLSSEQEDLLLDCLGNIPEGVTVIIQVSGAIDLRRRAAKFLKSKAEEFKEFKSFDRWDREEVVQWITRLIKAEGYSIDEEAAEFIAEVTGHSLGALNNELQKIITFTGKRKQIGLSDIKAVLSQGELSYYDLGEALRRKDIKTLLQLTGQLAKDGEKPQLILGFIASQLRFLLQLKEMQQQKKSYAEMAAAVRKHPYYVQKIVEKELSRYSWAELKKLYYELQQADLNGKTGLMSPFLAIETALASIVEE